MKVSVCIANHKQDQFLKEALDSIAMQTYKDIEVCVYNDTEGVGSGEAFNRAMAKAKGRYIVLLCADDYFTDPNVISDIVNCFEISPNFYHVSRWYYQFVDGDPRPVRAWRGDNVIELANNPSGLAFRHERIPDFYRMSNKMFVEAPTMVADILRFFPDNWKAHTILEYDTVAVRVHKSTARSKEYYRKMWTGSVVKEWAKLGWKTDDFTHLIQVANYYTKKAVWDEIVEFIRVNPFYILNPVFVFFSLTALCTPRCVLLYLPELYRISFGRLLTRVVKREQK